MKLNCWKLFLALFSLLTAVTSTEALPFTYQYGDLVLGFRKTGIYQASYEAVVDVGPAINFVNLAAGTTTNITSYSASQIDPDSFSNLTNLNWSVTGDTYAASTFPNYPINTLWVTVPWVGGVPSPAAVRRGSTSQRQSATPINSILNGAEEISSLLASNQDNTATFVQEAYATADGNNYGAFMADPSYPSIGDLDGEGPANVNGNTINLENTTVAPFTTGVKSDLYELRPAGAVDPHTGLTTGAGYNVGYFELNPNGTMTFTRTSATAPAPVAGFSGTPTNGFAPLQVVFTDASTGTITNWLWNLGDGTTVTNTSNASVTHTYATAGSYTVSLTVTGPGGANTGTQTGYIVASATPTIGSAIYANGEFVINGLNGPAGVQYRILTSTNLTLPLAEWKTLVTSTFASNGSFSYTNATTNATSFFQLVSP